MAFLLKTKVMKSDNEMPGNDRDYPESDISDNKKRATNQGQEGQSGQSQNDKEKQRKPVYIKDMPEIIPARTGII
jgi:hypothetical protein